jgi:hypothetical protein
MESGVIQMSWAAAEFGATTLGEMGLRSRQTLLIGVTHQIIQALPPCMNSMGLRLAHSEYH